MPHNNDINVGHQFVYYGTNIPYTGRVIEIGEHYFTTNGGGIEGDREEVTVIVADEGNIGNELARIHNDSVSTTSTSGGMTLTSDVVTAFIVGDNSTFGQNTYYYTNGSIVPDGTRLHHHTVPPNSRNNFMTQHTMDGNEQDVFTTPPTSRGVRGRQNVARTTTSTTTTTRIGGTGGGTTPRGGMSGY
tara:strand:- start:128 stop:691 length:564 start_codon:yes stop_codon:yes gene_type:complete